MLERGGYCGYNRGALIHAQTGGDGEGREERFAFIAVFISNHFPTGWEAK